MIAKRTCRRVTANNRFAADFERLIEALLASMAHINKHAQTVHLLDNLLAESTHTMMRVLCFRSRIANIVITIMTESHIYDTAIHKMLQILQLTVDSDTVLDTKHNALQALMLVHPEVARRVSDTYIIAVLTHNHLNLVENAISKGRRILGWLGQISYHDGSILTTFGHLVQIYKNLGVALLKVYALRKEHWCIAMGIECKHTIVSGMSFTKTLGLVNQPLEQGQAFFQTLGMPLNTQYRFKLATLHRFDDTIGRLGYYSELIASFGHSLMMERVNHHLGRFINIEQA